MSTRRTRAAIRSPLASALAASAAVGLLFACRSASKGSPPPQPNETFVVQPTKTPFGGPVAVVPGEKLMAFPTRTPFGGRVEVVPSEKLLAFQSPTPFGGRVVAGPGEKLLAFPTPTPFASTNPAAQAPPSATPTPSK